MINPICKRIASAELAYDGYSFGNELTAIKCKEWNIDDIDDLTKCVEFSTNKNTIITVIFHVVFDSESGKIKETYAKDTSNNKKIGSTIYLNI